MDILRARATVPAGKAQVVSALRNPVAGSRPPRPSAADGLAALQADLARQLQRSPGPHDGGYVYDITAKQALFSERATHDAPAGLGREALHGDDRARAAGPGRLATTVFGVGQLAPGGVWEGNLYLRGGGDPTFGSSAFIARHYGGIGSQRLGARRRPARDGDGIHRISGTVEGDEVYFDSLRGEPSSDYAPDPFLEGTLSALAFNRGETGREHGPARPGRLCRPRSCGRRCGADGVASAAPAGPPPRARRRRPARRRRRRRRSPSCSG